MPPGQQDELSRRFGGPIADALAAAYAFVIHRGDAYEHRFAVFQALLDEVEAGHTDASHLREVAEIFVSP